METARGKNSLWWPEERNLWKPPERITVSECADKYRILGKGSAQPGPWRTDFLPFLRDIMDCFGNDSVEEIWFIKPSQTGGTETILNMLLYAILQDPGPAMIIEPTKDLAEEISNDRVNAMITNCDQLQEIEAYEEEDLTKKRKSFSTMSVYFGWSGSPASLASRPIRYCFFDETNKYEKWSGEEASPPSLGKERTNTFIFIRKLVYISTPTKDTGYITVGEKGCDARFRYHVPCPHCGRLQRLIFEQVKFPKKEEITDVVKNGEKYNLEKRWQKEVEETAWYECEDCGQKIYEDRKEEMIRRGKWVDLISGLILKECLEETRPRRIGFQISRLYSPWHTWGMVAGEFLKVKDYPEHLMNWKNSWMAEEWIEKYETKTEKQILKNTIDLEPAVCPNDTIGLTCGIDPGQGGFWFVVLAWSYDLSPHLVHYGFLVGWDAVRGLVWETRYRIEGTGNFIEIWRSGIDIGGSQYENEDITMTAAAYEWLQKYGKGRAFATKGMSRKDATKKMKASLIGEIPGSKGKKKKLIPGGIILWMINTDSFKDMVHYRLEIEEGKTGRFTFHNKTEGDYFEQLLAEEKRRDRQGNMEWVKVKKHNHYLDCTVIAFALADIEAWGGIRARQMIQGRGGRKVLSSGVMM